MWPHEQGLLSPRRPKAVILAEAAELVAERGADGISLRELARAAGVSHAAPAHHFADRRGLFTALAAEGWRMLAAALARPGPNSSTPHGLRAVRARPPRPLRGDVRPLARRPRQSGAGRGPGRRGRRAGARSGHAGRCARRGGPAGRRTGGLVAGARLFDAVAQQGDRHRHRPDGHGAPSRGDAFQERVPCGP